MDLVYKIQILEKNHYKEVGKSTSMSYVIAMKYSVVPMKGNLFLKIAY